MQTHHDNWHQSADPFMERLRERAEQMDGKSKIAAGAPDEKPVAEWRHKNVDVKHLPNDEQDILRVSVGGIIASTPRFIYCSFRGPVGQCIAALEQAIEAMKKG